jgi:hypothetical protein
LGNLVWNGMCGLTLMFPKNRLAFSFRTLLMTSGCGVPSKSVMISSWCTTFFPGNKRPPRQDLGEDAADAPYVDRGCVLGEEAAAELGGAVPARGDVVGPEHGRGSAVVERRPGESEVANLEFAIRVGQDVLGLEVAVVHVRGVDVLEPSQQL